MPNLNSEYTQLIKQFQNEVNNISVNTLNSLKNEITQLNNIRNVTEQSVNHFERQIDFIFVNYQNDLLNKKNELYDSIDLIKSSTIDEIEDIKNIIEQKKQEALLQLNSSENSALVKLEEIYDVGVATILSAEKTALNNLGSLTDDLINKIKETSVLIDSQIKEKLNNSLLEIEKFANTLKEEIKETEIQIKENVKAEAQKIIEEAYAELNNIELGMQNFATVLKKELTEHKDLMIEEIRQDKEKFFIEVDREQNRIIEVLNLKEYEISTNLDKKEQAIISNIAMVVNGYDREMEEFKQSKLNEFIDSLKLIVDRTLVDIVDNAEELFKTQISRIIQEIEDAIMGDTLEATRKLLNEFSEQRYEFVLPAGETIITLSKLDYTITNRLKLYLDGILQVNKKHYTVDPINRIITLTRSFPDDIDVILTEDIPNHDIKEQLTSALSEIRNTTELCKAEINRLSDQLKEEIVSVKNSCTNEIINVKDNSIDEIENKKIDSIEEVRTTTEGFIKEYKSDLDLYVSKWKEGTYSTEVEANQTIVEINPRELILNRSAKVYCDGILQILSKHYSLDFLNNSIHFLMPFSYPIDLFVLQNLPVSDFPQREATNKEIDGLFEDFYRLGTDEDIDELYLKASDNDIDLLFNKENK